MNIVIFSRYPRFDKLAWKERTLRDLTAMGVKPVALIYGNTSLFDSFKWGMKTYGFKGTLKKIMGNNGNEMDIESKMFSRRISKVAKELQIPVFYVRDHNSKKCIKILNKMQPDLILLWGTGIIRKRILDIPKIGTLNSHYAILPKIRGMDVTKWAILMGQETGITIHFVSPGVDMGDILHLQKFQIEKGDSLQSIRLKCQENTSSAFTKVILKIKEIKHKPIRQDKDDGKQYFVMNHYLEKILIKKLENL
ncbi:MAG: hypothetical protein JSW00_01215 [Thermoplasmata archaeon]|nr:MAG: hypothetical protein JSW00_01215 [Thermoplasmata archaeon]